MFKDIKVGDEVFIKKIVNIEKGWRPDYKYFFVPVKVTRVTKAMFCSDNLRFKKEDGSGYGGDNCFAYKEGSIEGYYKKREVKNESKEYLQVKNAVKRYFDSIEKFKSFKLESSMSNEQLRNICNSFGEFADKACTN